MSLVTHARRVLGRGRGNSPLAQYWEANKPSGLTQFGDTQFVGMYYDQIDPGYNSAPAPPGFVGTAGYFTYADRGLYNTTDSASPFGGNVMAYDYAGNDAGNGVGPGLFANKYTEQWRSVYCCVAIKFAGLVGGQDYIFHTLSGSEKFFYPLGICAGGVMDPNDVFSVSCGLQWDVPGSGGTAGGPTCGIDATVQGAVGGTVGYTQTGGAVLTRGVWNILEVYLRTNDLGSSNGIAKSWVNGAAGLNSTNLVMTSANYTSAQAYFGQVRWDGTRGGGASSILTPAGGQTRKWNRMSVYYSGT